MMTPFFNINKLIAVNTIPLPTLEDIRSEVAGSQWFSELDLKSAFFQIPLEEGSRGLTASLRLAYACGNTKYCQWVAPSVRLFSKTL